MYNSEHTVGVGADSSRPYIIPEFIAQYIYQQTHNKAHSLHNISEHTVGVGAIHLARTIVYYYSRKG